MTAVTVQDRSVELLVSGQVWVRRVSDDRVVADVAGHRVEHRPGLGWSCDCPSFRFRHHCAHVDAVELVTCPTGDRL